MFTNPSITAAIAREQIQDRIRDADARRLARAARESARTAPPEVEARPRRRWNWVPRRVFTRSQVRRPICDRTPQTEARRRHGPPVLSIVVAARGEHGRRVQ